jgi:hypothetical protein
VAANPLAECPDRPTLLSVKGQSLHSGSKPVLCQIKKQFGAGFNNAALGNEAKHAFATNLTASHVRQS